MEVITVTSKGQDPSRFISNFTNSIRFSEDYEVGLLKIAYPPVINVSDKNNKIYISKKGVSSTTVLEIPTGFYETTHDVAQAIYEVLTEFQDEEMNTSVIFRYSASGNADHAKLTLQFEDKKTVFVVNEMTVGNVLYLLEYRIKKFTTRTLTIQNYDLPAHDQLGFIYSSIVSNSLIDYRVSRLLDTVAIRTPKNGGHCLFEVQNPVFHDVSAASFIDISFEIHDIDGNFLHFHGDLPTILTLGIRKKRNHSI